MSVKPTGELIDELGALEELAPEWDALAVSNGRPTCAPAWMLGWLKHMVPEHAHPRVVVVREDEELIGIAPFFADTSRRGRVDYRLLGVQLGTRLAPLATPSREWEVAGVVASTLAEATPRPDLIALEGYTARFPWLTALGEQWPGRWTPLNALYNVLGTPTVSLRGSYDEWLASRSASFRKNQRRRARLLGEAGGKMRISSLTTLHDDVQALLDLHAARWSGRGESSLVARRERMASMLIECGTALSDSGRFRIWLMEIEGRPVWANLFLSAGGELMAINSGWDEQWRKLSPPTLGMIHALEDAFARGERRLDLGVGEDPYKLEFADGNDPVGWGILIPPGRRMTLTGLRVTPMLVSSMARRTAKRALSEERLRELRKLHERLRI